MNSQILGWRCELLVRVCWIQVLSPIPLPLNFRGLRDPLEYPRVVELHPHRDTTTHQEPSCNIPVNVDPGSATDV
ncbi:hypothetical protein DICA1_E30702 [Diutina catenulata]